MLSDAVANRNRHNISDDYTQDVAVYDPLGLESLETYVSPIPLVCGTRILTQWLSTAPELHISWPLIILA